MVSGATDEEAGKVAGVGRQSISRWRHNDALFIKELNIAKNRQARLTMDTYQKWMNRAMATAVNEVGKAIVRGDVATAKWLLERLGIDAFARQTFQQAVDPVILPEETPAIIDEIAGRRVDEFLTEKGVGPLERLRLRKALTVKEAAALRAENKCYETPASKGVASGVSVKKIVKKSMIVETNVDKESATFNV